MPDFDQILTILTPERPDFPFTQGGNVISYMGYVDGFFDTAGRFDRFRMGMFDPNTNAAIVDGSWQGVLPAASIIRYGATDLTTLKAIRFRVWDLTVDGSYFEGGIRTLQRQKYSDEIPILSIGGQEAASQRCWGRLMDEDTSESIVRASGSDKIETAATATFQVLESDLPEDLDSTIIDAAGNSWDIVGTARDGDRRMGRINCQRVQE